MIRAPRKYLNPIISLYPSILVLCALVIVWQEAVQVFSVPAYIVPAPSAIFNALVNSKIQWVANSEVTLIETVGGFGISIVIAIPLALIIAYSSWLNKALYPLIIATQFVPKVAIAPILFIMFGFTYLPRIIVVILAAFFPLLVDTIAGLSTLDPDQVDLLKSLGYSDFRIFRTAKFRNALPYVFTGLKISATFAVVGAVVAEFVQSDAGLGYVLLTSLIDFGTADAFAALLLLTAIGIALYFAVVVVESVSIPWYRRSKLASR